MRKFSVSLDEIDESFEAKDDFAFTEVGPRFLISDRTVGAKALSLFNIVFPPGFGAHKKHVHVNVEEVLFCVRGHGVIGFQYGDGNTEQYDVTRGVAVFVPKNVVHWFQNNDREEELELYGALSIPNAERFKPEDYVAVA